MCATWRVTESRHWFVDDRAGEHLTDVAVDSASASVLAAAVGAPAPLLLLMSYC